MRSDGNATCLLRRRFAVIVHRRDDRVAFSLTVRSAGMILSNRLVAANRAPESVPAWRSSRATTSMSAPAMVRLELQRCCSSSPGGRTQRAGRWGSVQKLSAPSSRTCPHDVHPVGPAMTSGDEMSHRWSLSVRVMPVMLPSSEVSRAEGCSNRCRRSHDGIIHVVTISSEPGSCQSSLWPVPPGPVPRSSRTRRRSRRCPG